MPGLLRARGRLGPGRRSRPARSRRTASGSSPARRSGRAAPSTPSGACSWPAPTPRRRQAQGPHVLPDGHGAGRGAGPAAAPDHRRVRVQRAVHRGGQDSRRERARRRGQRLEGRADDADERARRARVLPPGAAAPGARRGVRRGRPPRPARRSGDRRPARRASPQGRGPAAHRLPRPDRDRALRTAGPGGVADEVDVVGDQPAADPVRGRRARPRGADRPGDRWSYELLRARGNTIEGGTTEILKNIVAERVLGLPKAR